MEQLRTMLVYQLPFILVGIAILFLILFIVCMVLAIKLKHQKKKYDFFMGTNRRPTHNLETKLEDFFEKTQAIDEKYTKLVDSVTDLEGTMKSNLQKVGFVRYNPFDEMGGNLCFAIALLDGNDNGVVINGIHSRTGSFTYAKSVEMGASIYSLSQEEVQAIQLAKKNAFHPTAEKQKKVKIRKKFSRSLHEKQEKNCESKEKVEENAKKTVVENLEKKENPSAKNSEQETVGTFQDIVDTQEWNDSQNLKADQEETKFHFME